MTDASPGIRWVARATTFAGLAIAGVGAVLYQTPGWQGQSVIPMGLVVVGILLTCFGLLWLLALKRQRLWFPRDDLGPKPPSPPTG